MSEKAWLKNKWLVSSALFMLVWPWLTWAEESPRVSCHTPTTSFEVTSDKDQVVATVTHHQGSRFTPIANGLVLPYELDSLKEKARLIEQLGKTLEFSWLRKSCRVVSRTVFTCTEGQAKVIAGHPVKGFILSSTRVDYQTGEFRYEKLALAMKLMIDGDLYPIHMDYPLARCY